MRAFSAAAGLCLAAMAMAGPTSLEPRQGATAVGTVNSSISALTPALPQYEAAIGSAVVTIQQSTSVQYQIILAAEAVITANLAAVVSGLNDSANAIVAATVNATGGVTAAASGLIQSDINMLQADILIVQNIIAGLNATFTATASLEASVRATYQSEVDALKRVIRPFINPIILFAQAAVEVTTGYSVSGLAAATVGLQTIANNFYQSIGV